MRKVKTTFVCQECGVSSAKWLGRCPDCGAWNSLIEELETPQQSGPRLQSLSAGGGPRPYLEVSSDAASRLATGIEEFDRVLGGGVVAGSLVLLGGDPGIGKSTLLLQVASRLAASTPDERPVLYISGEESEQQIKLRGERLGVKAESLLLFSETNLDTIISELKRHEPSLVVLDSVQTVYSPKFSSAPGSVSQVREAAVELLYFAKSTGTPVFLIGHVTKEGNLAGPKALEHIVDTVLYFEGERHYSHRLVRATKNRYGAAGELGVFEMTGSGLEPVENPSGLFLSERPEKAPGSVVVCSLEGTRPLLVEIQALVSRSSFGYPRRVTLGIDSNRVALLLAVLEKRIGLQLSAEDVYVNVAGGLVVDEPVADLGLVAAVASSFKGRPVDSQTVLLGEVGLAGEVRAAQQVALRVKEAARLGFNKIILPTGNLPLPDEAGADLDVELVGVRNVGEALEAVF
ncbi:MAG: DNA repair protein RadA [Vicinamibacteria bacterium]